MNDLVICSSRAYVVQVSDKYFSVNMQACTCHPHPVSFSRFSSLTLLTAEHEGKAAPDWEF